MSQKYTKITFVDGGACLISQTSLFKEDRVHPKWRRTSYIVLGNRVPFQTQTRCDSVSSSVVILHCETKHFLY